MNVVGNTGTVMARDATMQGNKGHTKLCVGGGGVVRPSRLVTRISCPVANWIDGSCQGALMDRPL